jgi:hypothetical protein
VLGGHLVFEDLFGGHPLTGVLSPRPGRLVRILDAAMEPASELLAQPRGFQREHRNPGRFERVISIVIELRQTDANESLVGI